MHIKTCRLKYLSAVLALIFAAVFLSMSPGGLQKARASSDEITILALGDSLTAGYDLPAHAAFPNKLQKELRDKGYPVHIINAGVSGDTAQGGLNRLEWSLGENTDLVILALGANDALRGLDPVLTKQALAGILRKLSKRDIPVLLVGMYAPSNMGSVYTRKFNAVYPALSKEFKVPLYPFFLEGVALKPEYNLSDGIHPNERGIKVIVENILPHVEKLILKISEEKSGKT